MFAPKRQLRLAGLIALAFWSLSTACTPKQIASDITSQILVGGAPSMEWEDDVEMTESSALTMLKMLESFRYDNPKNKNYNLLLSRSYANYAMGFLEWNMLKYRGVDETKRQQSEDRAVKFYSKGKDYGINVLSRHGGFKSALTKDLDTFKKSLRSFGRGSVPALFWTAMNWGSLINLKKDSPIAIAEFPKVEAIMQRVLELDEFYFYGSPHLFMGFSFGSRPAMFGGDMKKSKDHFEKGVNAYKRKFLLGLVFYAQGYCVQAQDHELYKTLLNEVLTTDAAVLPEQRLANELAKLRAKWMLDNESKVFGGI